MIKVAADGDVILQKAGVTSPNGLPVTQNV